MQLIGLGAVISCSFGTELALMTLPPEAPLLDDMRPAATILDFVPFANIPPFGLCTSLANPAVAEATALAEGVLTPQRCIPATATPWFPGAPEVLFEGVPALCMGSNCLCVWRGKISIDEPGQDSLSIET